MSLWKRIYLERRRMILPIAALLLANIAVLLLAVLPLQKSVEDSQQSAVEAMGKLVQARRLASTAKDARGSKERADEELKRFYTAVLPTDLPPARDLIEFWIERTAREAGVIKKNSTLDWEQEKDSRLVRVKSRVVFTGDYNSIRRFLYAAETSTEFVVIEKVELSQAGSAQGTANNTIEVSMNLSTYYLSGAQ